MEIKNDNYTILAIDDHDANLLLLKAILGSVGFSVITATSAAMAFEVLKQQKPDVIIMDIMMPLMDGYEATAIIKSNEEYKDIPIIFLTALVTSEDVVKCFKSGGSDYISKPFNRDELIARVSNQASLQSAKKQISDQNNELKKIMEHRDRLYSVIAHDLRGPLGTIKMIMECLQTNLQNKNIGFDNMELLSEANKLSDELFQLLDNLLKWTKNQLGRLNLVYQKVDIRDIVLSVVEFYAMISQFKSIQIVTEVSSELFAYTDIDVVKTILRNFINNAIKFSYTNSAIVVGARKKDNMIEIFVRDSGQGMPEDKQMKLRNREFMSSSFGTNKEEGTGMGLILSRDLIDRIGGVFEFESELGVGTTFCFSVPVCDD